MKTVVCFSVQAGSRGEGIAQQVALNLGYRYYEWEIVARAAQLLGIEPAQVAESEQWPKLLWRMLDGFAIGDVEFDLTGRLPLGATLPARFYHFFIEQVISEIASGGHCVLVGHASDLVLRKSQASLFRVLTTGGEAARARFIARSENISEASASRVLRRRDAQTAGYLRHYYRSDWLKAASYDLTLMTDGIENRAAAAVLAAAIQAATDFAGTDGVFPSPGAAPWAGG